MRTGDAVGLVFLATLNAGLLLPQCAAGATDDTEIALKRRSFKPKTEESVRLDAEAVGRHLILQFEAGRLDEAVEALEARGVRVLEFVPRYAVSAFVPAGTSLKGVPGLRWAGALQVEDKISRQFGDKKGEVFVLVSSFPEVDKKRAREHVSRSGGRVIENPYLKTDHLLVAIDAKEVPALTANDEVSFVFPASKEIIEGKPVHFCPGPMTPVGPIGEYVTQGDGWDGQGLGSAALKYHFITGTPDVAGTSEFDEVRRALNVWSQFAQITWTETALANQTRSLDITWASGNHGDGSPFDGAGRVLAHCYYPSPPNPEPIAGDMHFDEGDSWRLGSDIDVFSVALHEAGHGLGLNHSSDTNAVMYPYYQLVTGLRSDDIAGIRALYAATGGGTSGDTFEPDNTAAQAKVITDGSNQSHSILPATDVDYATFILTAPAAVTIETSGGSGDTRLWLYNSSQTEIEFNDDGNGLFSRIDRTVAEGNTLPAGTYFVKVDEFGNNDQIASYTLGLTVQYLAVGDNFEPDDSVDQAKTIFSGSPQVHSLVPATDDDYVQFTLTAQSEVVIETSGSSGDTTMRLFGSDASEIEFDDDDGAGLFSRIDRRSADGDTLAPGTYYVLISEFGNNNEIASYTVNLAVAPLASDDAYEQNDGRTQAYHPGFNWEATSLSALNGPGIQSDDDWYRIDVTPSGFERVVIDCFFTHSQGDVDITLHNSAGTLLASSLGVTDSEHIDFTVPTAGTYYIRVFGPNGGNTYDLTWDDRSVAAITPPNDAFSDRIELFGQSVRTAASSVNATKEMDEPYHAAVPGGASIWWRWTAPASGVVTMNTLGSDFDTLLAVYIGSAVSSLTQVVGNDDGMGTLASFVSFIATANAIYQIAVDGFDSEWGAVRLSLNQPTTNHQPDALIGFSVNFMLGDGIHNESGSGQGIHANLRRGRSQTCLVFVQNDGALDDTIRVMGTAGSSRFAVHYYFGSVDVTAAIVAGTFAFPSMASGDADTLTVVVRARANARRGQRRNVYLVLTSESDPNVRDVVLYSVTAR